MALNGHRQRSQQSFGGEEIHNQPLRHTYFSRRDAEGMGIQTQIENDFFGNRRHAAEIRVTRRGFRIVQFDLLTHVIGRFLAHLLRRQLENLFVDQRR